MTRVVVKDTLADPEDGAVSAPWLRAASDSACAPDELSGDVGADGVDVIRATDEEALISVRVAAITAERERIASEMSGSAGKSLLGIAMIAASLASTGLSGDARSLDYRLRELGRLARRAVTEANGVIHDLREDAVAAELRSVAGAWSLASRIPVTVEVPRSTETTEQIRREFSAMLREALANVAQHSHATHVLVSLRSAGEQLRLAVEDNGTGFRLPSLERELRPPATGGLARMQDRASRLDGVVLIRSSDGAGTRVEVRIPGPDFAGIRLPDAAAAGEVRVVIADRNPVLRLGLRVVLERAPGIEVVAEAATTADLAELVAEHVPDVLLLDAAMTLPGEMRTVRQLGALTSVVLVSCGAEVPATEVAAAGARLCALHGEFDYSDLVRLIRDAARAHSPRLRIESSVPGDSVSDAQDPPDSVPGRLRPREREVMQLIAEGLSNRQIAARLVVSEKTVKNHISSIYSRLGVRGRSQALRSWTLDY